ncbi:MAG: glycosyltransferase [Candidatus Sericytochromatia bacterium]|nr:glycosyltransferase [Candidatus Tanganyikabacteria bacterium]
MTETPARRLLLLSDGPSAHTAKWAGEFARRGWDVHVGSLRDVDIPGATVHALARSPAGPARYLEAAGRARALAARLRPDIVHAHYASSYGFFGAVAGRRPLVVTLWGSDGYEFPRRGPAQAALFRWSLARADALTAVCRDLAAAAEPFAPGREVAVIPFGVDLDRFSPAPAPPAGSELVVGCLKPLEPVYGHGDLLAALATLRGRRPDLAVRLRLAGAGYLRADLEALAARLGLADRVEFLGRLPADDVPAFYRGLHCFVLASLSEGLAVAAEEAAACGLPIVATRVGGNPEIVRDGETGTLVPPRDPQALSRALEDLLGHPERRSEYGRRAREWAAAHFELRACGDRFAALYARLTGQ